MSTHHVEQKTVPFKAILVPEDQNVRQDLPRVKELAASIEKRGLLQPVVVTNGGEGDKPYTLVSGYRRMAALATLGWKDVPVVVREYKKGVATPVERIVDNIRENSDREDMHILDVAERAAQLVEGTYPVAPGETAEPVEKKVVAEMLGWGIAHLNNVIRVFTNLDADVAKKARKAEVPLSIMLKWAAIEGKGKTDEARAEDLFEKQMAAFEEWEKAKEELEASGRKRKPRKAKAEGGVRGGGDDGGDHVSMLNKSKTDLLAAHIIVLKSKLKDAKAEGDVAKEAIIKGRIEALRFVTGDLASLPGVTQKDLDALEAEDEAVEEDGEE